MRCKNCGWPNKPSVTKCIKCDAPLSSADEDLNFIDSDNMSQSAQSLNKTVLEEEIFGGSHQNTPDKSSSRQSNVENNDALSQCPKCGYPLRPGVEKCPNCKFQLNSNSHIDKTPARSHISSPSTEDTYRRPTRMSSDSGSKGAFRGTINPYMMNMDVEPTFILKPIKRIDERHTFNEQEYEGKEVILNRDNTEQNNSSITSKQQAVITNVDGHWYIEDKSEQKTTFVQAAQKIELHDGDIILLGDRLFEFHK